MERRIAIVLAVLLSAWAALYAVDIKLFHGVLSTPLLNAVPVSWVISSEPGVERRTDLKESLADLGAEWN